MLISTKGRYALRFMIDLAKHGQEDGKLIVLREVSARQNISVKYLEQIASNLCKNGLLYSSRGQQGGYRLAKPAEEYPVGEILHAIEGRMAPVSCLDGSENLCPMQSKCPSLLFWTGLDQTVDQYLNSVTLAQLAGIAPYPAKEQAESTNLNEML